MPNQSLEVGTSRFSIKTATDNRLQSFEKCSIIEPAKQRYYLQPKRSFFLTIMLVAFLFAANFEAKAEEVFPPLPPWQINEWKPLHIHMFSKFVIYNGCRFEFKVGVRELEDQPVPKPFPPLFEYYIYEITIVGDCDMDEIDIIRYYKEIVEAWMPIFAHFLFDYGWLNVGPCGQGGESGYNIVRVGHPSCVTDVYYEQHAVTNPDPNNPNIQIVTIKKITSCRSFDPYSICRSVYEYCWDATGMPKLIKKEDGEASIICPASIKVSLGSMYPPSDMIDVNCHPVCGFVNQFPSSINQESITEIAVVPNPTNNETTLTLEVLTPGNLTIILVNVEGKELIELQNAQVEAGAFTRHFSMAHFPVGVYYLKISHNGNVKMMEVIRN